MDLKWLAANASELLEIGLIPIIIAILIWGIRHLYKDQKACEEARLEDRKDIGELKGQVGELKGTVNTLQSLQTSHLAELVRKNNG